MSSVRFIFPGEASNCVVSSRKETASSKTRGICKEEKLLYLVEELDGSPGKEWK